MSNTRPEFRILQSSKTGFYLSLPSKICKAMNLERGDVIKVEQLDDKSIKLEKIND